MCRPRAFTKQNSPPYRRNLWNQAGDAPHLAPLATPFVFCPLFSPTVALFPPAAPACGRKVGPGLGGLLPEQGMNLPGKLRRSTLGDLLGKLHRSGVSGVLALRELQGVSAGRIHRIHLKRGLIVGIATGDTPETTERSLVKQRLESLFLLDDAELSFHVARRGAELEAPLTPVEFLHGRPRERDRQEGARGPKKAPERGVEVLRKQALAVLGLGPSATLREIQRAFRTQALALHPDRHPGASEARRAELSGAFARLTQAYRVLLETPAVAC